MWGFALLHVLVIVVLSFMLPGAFKNNQKVYQDLVYAMHTDEILKLVNAQRYDFQLATPSYSQSALLSYHAREHVIVFGNGSYHGREDDIITDMKKFKGKGIAIVSFKDDVTQYAKYFNSFTHIILPVQGSPVCSHPAGSMVAAVASGWLR